MVLLQSLEKNRIDPVHDDYKNFKNPYIMDTPDDNETNTIVALESKTPILRRFRYSKRTIWWMSVDNFYLNMGNIVEVIKRKYFGFKPTLEYCMKFKNKAKYQVFKDEDIIHFVQSEYARLFLINEGVNKDRIFDLSDYIEDEVIEAHQLVNKYNRSNTILYNPKKGYAFTQEIMKANPQYNWTPLINMSKTVVIDTLLKSKLYIDFGTHPGKDRFPREAILCGCCLITGRRGAAANDVDIPIFSKYKIDDSLENIPRISEVIKDIMDNYESRVKDYEEYCLRTLDEKRHFEQEAILAFGGK